MNMFTIHVTGGTLDDPSFDREAVNDALSALGARLGYEGRSDDADAVWKLGNETLYRPKFKDGILCGSKLPTFMVVKEPLLRSALAPALLVLHPLCGAVIKASSLNGDRRIELSVKDGVVYEHTWVRKWQFEGTETVIL